VLHYLSSCLMNTPALIIGTYSGSAVLYQQ